MIVTGIALTAALSACGGGGSSDRAASRPQAKVTVTVTASPSGSSSSQPGLPPPVPSDVMHVDQLVSPSGNIRCVLTTAVECVIQKATYEPMQRPTCQSDWNDHFFGVGRRSGIRGTCAGDPILLGDLKVLPYGATSTITDRACSSEQSGMTCWDTTTGHGFVISRARYTIF